MTKPALGFFVEAKPDDSLVLTTFAGMVQVSQMSCSLVSASLGNNASEETNSQPISRIAVWGSRIMA